MAYNTWTKGCWACAWQYSKYGEYYSCGQDGGLPEHCGHATAWEAAGSPKPPGDPITAIWQDMAATVPVPVDPSLPAWPSGIPTQCGNCGHEYTSWSDNLSISNPVTFDVVPTLGGKGGTWFCKFCSAHFPFAGGMSTNKGSNSELANGKGPNFPAGKGCAACVGAYTLNGYANPCGVGQLSTGDLSIVNPKCAYASAANYPDVSQWLKEKGYPTGPAIHKYVCYGQPYTVNEYVPDKWPFPKDKGCLACVWRRAMVKKAHGTVSAVIPCEAGITKKANKECKYFYVYLKAHKYWAPKPAATEAEINAGPAKKPWPFTKPQIGCVACAAYKQAGGSGKACMGGLGPEGADPGCHRYQWWKDSGEPPITRFTTEIPPWEPIKDVQFQGKKYTGKGGCAEHTVGIKQGLDLKLDLATACADFYILERLAFELLKEHSSLSETLGVSRASGPRLRYPTQFGSDLRREMRAIVVQQRWDYTVEFLAKQLSTYLLIACGGELRHGPSNIGISVTKSGPVKWKRLKCGHQCDKKCSGVTKTGRSKCGHKCTPECLEYMVPERVLKYWRGFQYEGHSGSRSGCWGRWAQLSHRNPVAWMYDCASVFSDVKWAGGFGGAPWGVGAALCADFLAGRIKPVTFIDRCWSLQHHGGCMFNKFYHIDTLYTRHGETAHDKAGHSFLRLMYILNVQAAGDYEHLAQFSSVGYLWNEHVAERARMAYTDRLAQAAITRYHEGVDAR